MALVALRGLGEAGSLEHRLGVAEPSLLLAQPRHRRLGQRVEGARERSGALSLQELRASPSDDVPARAAGTTPTFDLAVADFLNASSPIRRRPRGAKRAWGHPRGSRLLNPRLRFVRVGDV